MSWSPSPHLQLKMSVWSLESFLFLLLVSQPRVSAAHTPEKRRFLSLGRLPLSQSSPQHTSFDLSKQSVRRRATSTYSVTNGGSNIDRPDDAPITPVSSIPKVFQLPLGRWKSSASPGKPISSAMQAAQVASTCEVETGPTMADDSHGATGGVTSTSSVQSLEPNPPGHSPQPIWMKRFTSSTLSHLPINFSNCLPPLLRRHERKPVGTANSHDAMSSTDESILVTLTQPLIPEHTWQQMTGSEFQDHPELLASLAAMGEAVARNDDARGEWIAWHEYGSSTTASNRKKKNHADESPLHYGDIHVWTGKCVAAASDQDDRHDQPQTQYFGAHLPLIKTRSIIPFAVEEMVDLLLDSTRVQLYNPWSLGRRDCWVAVADNTRAVTKIVKNRVQPPLGSKAMVSITLLHARPALSDDGSWVVVSRSVGQHGSDLFASPSDDDTSAGRSDILLGVNLLQPVSDDSCILTAVTHVYSPAVPMLLAERLGVQSAIKFVKDMRKLKAAATTPAERERS